MEQWEDKWRLLKGDQSSVCSKTLFWVWTASCLLRHFANTPKWARCISFWCFKAPDVRKIFNKIKNLDNQASYGEQKGLFVLSVIEMEYRVIPRKREENLPYMKMAFSLWYQIFVWEVFDYFVRCLIVEKTSIQNTNASLTSKFSVLYITQFTVFLSHRPTFKCLCEVLVSVPGSSQ